MKHIIPILVILLLVSSGFVGVSYSIADIEQSSMSAFYEGSLSGYVNNTSMNPIEGALVRVSFHGTYEENYTDTSGYYHVTNIPICNCTKNCTASKSGYKTEWVLLSIDENTTHDFILTPLGNILYVGCLGPHCYNTIQDAIDDANDGDTVYVYDDSSPYYENLVVNKSINLIGEDRDTTVVDGNWRGNVINVTADWITISGFTIRYGDRKGIYFYRSNNNSISGNNIFGNWDGIYLKYSNDNTVIDNIISNNDDGISLWFSGNNNIASNTITSNYNGMYLNGFHVEYNIIISNTISNNYNGIRFVNGKNNTIIGNNISSNHMDGLRFVGGRNNTIYHNNLIKNTMNAEDFLHNTWDNGYPSGGNYWDDYNGTDADGDGIGDTPYNISGGSNQDLYPLMHPFELYYILNISAPPEVNEEELFNVLVKSIGGTAIPSATVEFNDELKLTDMDGRVYFTAPQVGADTTYDIIATKEGYTGDTKQILVKDVLIWFNYAFIFGRLDNLTTEEEIITFEALNIRAITFFPFTFNHYTSGEFITISKYYFGLVGARFIFAFCGLSYPSSAISMNIFDRDDFANKIIWMVSGVEGNPIGINNVETMLLNESGEPQPDAEITFNDNNGDGLITPGDTFTVVAPSDGNYVFLLIHELTGATIYKSALTHY